MGDSAPGTIVPGNDLVWGDEALPVSSRVAFRKIATIYENTPEPVTAGLVYSVMVGYIVWDAAPQGLVLTWTILRVLLCLIRINETRRFMRDDRRAWNAESWRARYIVLMVLEGLSWSMMGVLFLPYVEGMVGTLIFASVLCIAAIGVFTLVSHFPTAVANVTTILSPVALEYAWTGGRTGWFIVVSLILYGGVLLNEAKRADRRWAEMIRLRLENAEIAAQREAALWQAEQASAAKSAFLATMSHEIRTPLNGMMGLTELILQSDISPENRRYLDLSLQSATHLLHLVDEVLDMSKIQAGGLTLAMAPFSLHQLLEELGALFMARASEKNLTLETRMAAGVPKRLIGDAMRLRQVLANLLGNAIKFTDAGTVALRVEVVSGKQGEGSSSALCRLRFSVVDTGTGISNDQQEAVFKAFTQADGSTARRHGGTGLGLTISAALVEMMGSRIELVSRLGEGSTFSFDLELPVAPEPAASPQDAPIGGKVCESPSQELEKGLDGLRLLLCEDNDVNALIVMRTFEKEGAEVLRVGTGRAGVDAARTRDFDAVIMDLQMPDMDGLEATRRIRAWEQQQGRLPMPILALTANAMPDDRESCIAAGMNAFLTKPIRPATLVEALERSTQGPVRSPALRSGVDGPAG